MSVRVLLQAARVAGVTMLDGHSKGLRHWDERLGRDRIFVDWMTMAFVLFVEASGWPFEQFNKNLDS
jgi:hypothetical protein